MKSRRKTVSSCVSGFNVLDLLESRRLLSGVSASNVPVALPSIASTVLVSSARPDKGPPVQQQQTQYTPAQIRAAYGITGTGLGQKIAIIDAYHAPTLAADYAAFNTAFLSTIDTNPAGTLSVAYAQGSQPTVDTGWAQESTLDVEWAHAIAPDADILLVECASNSFNDLLGGVDYAVGQGAKVVSMSWGGGEFLGETSYDYHFAAPASTGGVTFVASSGDNGGVVQWPSISPYVVGVGGTSLKTNADGTYKSETAWNGSGGGTSKYESKPAYQSGVNSSSTRTAPDVGYDADPSTGVYVIYNGSTYIFGGTSIGAPQWASLIANANVGRSATLNGFSETLPALYALPHSSFHDVISGSAGRNKATAGYDLATGLGTPIASSVVPGLFNAGPAIASPATLSGTGGGSAHGLFDVEPDKYDI